MFHLRNELVFEQIDELNNYDKTCIALRPSSSLFYRIVIVPVKLIKVSYPKPLEPFSKVHDPPAGCFIFVRRLFDKNENM